MKTKWEYKVILSYGISDERTLQWQEQLDRLGADGWELVSVIVRPEVPSIENVEDAEKRIPRTVAFLKREK